MAETFEGPELTLPDDFPKTLFQALLDAESGHGGSTRIVEDADFGAMSYRELIRAALALARHLSQITERGEHVGVFLPTGVPAAIVFFALQAGGRVPAFFNYGQDAKTVAGACETAGVKRVISSRTFVKAGDLQDTEDALAEHADIVHLEDLKDATGILDKAYGAAGEALPALVPDPADPEDVAVILFTSGTTGAPKGVALSHANILANIAQCRQHIEFEPDWVFFSPLPVFHSLGLTGGMLLPILTGRRTVLHPNPLERKTIIERLHETGANVLVATDAFARLYAREAGEGELDTLKYLVLGGEPVHDKTRELWDEHSPAVLIEGYGLSETAPVVALNRPDANRPDSVGTLVPGMEAKLEEVEGVSEGRELHVRGPNLMIGYLDPDDPGRIVAYEKDWFDTGDLASVDEDGFITITGRVKRFAEIGGEMISLDRVERAAKDLWSEANHAAMAVEREEGETIVLVSDAEEAGREAFSRYVSEHDLDKRLVPGRVVKVDSTPMTPTGSPDYPRIRDIVREEAEGEPTT